MSSVSHAPRVPRMRPEVAPQIAQQRGERIEEIELLLEQIVDERAALAGAGSRLRSLQIALKERADAIESEKNKPVGVRDDARLARLELEYTSLNAALPPLLNEVAQVDAKFAQLQAELAECERDIKEANRVVYAESREGEDTPVPMLDADDAYGMLQDARTHVLEQVSEEFGMEAVKAVERVIQPLLKRLQPLFALLDETRPGTKQGLQVMDKDAFPVLTEAECEAFALACEDLPGIVDAAGVAEEVRKRFADYRQAQELLKTDPANAIKHLKELNKRAIFLETLPKLLGPENAPAAVQARREEYTKKKLAEEARYQPAIIVAERELHATTAKRGDVERLAKARAAEIEEVDLGHPVFHSFETDEGEEAYLLKKLNQIGLPVEPKDLKAALDARRRLSPRGAPAKTDETLMTELEDDIIHSFFSGKLTDPSKQVEVEARLKELKKANAAPPAPKPELYELLLHSVRSGDSTDPDAEPEGKPEDNGELIKEIFQGYFQSLRSGLASGLSKDEMQAKLLEAIDESMAIGDLLDGTMREEQEADGIKDPAVLRKDPMHYVRLVAKLEGVTSPRADRVRQEVPVIRAFKQSMEHADAIEKMQASLREVNEKRKKLSEDGKTRVEQSIESKRVLAETERVRREVLSYLLERELPVLDGPDTTKRKQIETNWAVTHQADIAEAERKEAAAKKEAEAAALRPRRVEDETVVKSLPEEITRIQRLVWVLETGDREKLLKNKQQFDELLSRLPAVQVGTKDYSAVAVVNTAFGINTPPPLARVSPEEFLPREVRELTLEKAYAHGATPDTTIPAAFQFAVDQGEKASAPAKWFAEQIGHTNGKDDAWRATFDAELQKVHFGAERALKALTERYEQAAHEVHLAIREASPDVVQRRKLANLLQLKAQSAKEAIDLFYAGIANAKKQRAETEALPALKRLLKKNPKDQEVEQLLQVAYQGLKLIVYAATDKNPVDESKDLRKKSFETLLSALRQTQPDPQKTSRWIKYFEIAKKEQDACRAKLLAIAQAVEKGPEIDLPAKEALLAEKYTAITTLDQTAISKQAEYEACQQETARIKAETVEDKLKVFDLETSKHISTVLDKDGLLGKDERLLEQQANISDLREEVRLLVNTSAERYKAWLAQKGPLTTLTAQPTETEKAAVEGLKTQAASLLTLFEKRGGNVKDAVEFERWFASTTRDDRFRHLMNEIIPGIEKIEPPAGRT